MHHRLIISFVNKFLLAAIILATLGVTHAQTSKQTTTVDDEVVDACPPFIDRGKDSMEASDEWLKGKWTVEWADEFDGDGELDKKKWHFYLPKEPQRNKTAYLTNNHAFRKNGQLIMEAVTVNNRAEMSQIRSYNDMNPGWDRDFPNDDDFLLDPTNGPLYIETSVRFDKANPAFRAWWAFWLLSPNADWMKDTEGNPRIYGHYNGNADSGSEVDIFEYVPDVNSSGFNIALYKSQPSKDNPDKGIRPDDKMFTCENTLKTYEVELNDGRHHKIGFYYSTERYAFYLNDKLIWTFTETEKPGWITKLARNGILLTWEADNLGPWGQPRLKNDDGSPKTFASEKTNARILIDYVRVHRLENDQDKNDKK